MVPQITKTATQLRRLATFDAYYNLVVFGGGIVVGLIWLYAFIHSVRP